MQKVLAKEARNGKYAGRVFHILRRVSIHEAFLFFTDEEHYTGKFAQSLDIFVREIDNVPLKSIEFHFERGDFQKWIRNIIGDNELASRFNCIEESMRGVELRKTIKKTVKERIDQLKHEMLLAQNRATRLEKTISFGRRMIFGIDLLKIDGEGEVICPKCREILSPNDPAGMTYEVLDSINSEDGALVEAFLQCKRCGSIIRLHGFAMLREIEHSNLLS